MKIVKRIMKSNFIKGVLVLVGGTTFSQVLNVILSPIITRIYSPEQFGMLTLYTAIIGIIAVGSFKYELAIPLADSEKKAANIILMCIILLSLFTLITLFVLLIINYFFHDAIKFDQFIWLIPLGVFSLGIYQIFKQWTFRLKEFKNLSRSIIFQNIIGNLVKVLGGFIGLGGSGLILGHIVGQSLGVSQLTKSLFTRKQLINCLNKRTIFWSIKRYNQFPLYSVPIHLLTSVGRHLPIIFITFFYGSQVVGLYGLAYSVVRLPMTLVGQAIGDVFFAEAAAIGRKNVERIKRLSNRLVIRLALIGILPSMLLILFGPQLFSIVFGDSWFESGKYASIATIMSFFMLIFAPVSRIYEVYEKQKLKLVIDIIRIILICIVFGLSWFFELNSYLAILMYSIVVSAIHFVIYIFAQRIMNSLIRSSSQS